MNSLWMAVALLAQATQPAGAAPGQAGTISVHGEVATMVAVYPEQNGSGELRVRAAVDVTADPRPWLRLQFEGIAEGLYAERTAGSDATRRREDVIASVRDAWAEVRLNDVEIRAGYGRIVWGRLDEVMPSDVINPIDTARFFLNGRGDARLPVAFVRTRVYLPSEARVELVASLPGSRGRFDSIDEPTSPFNLLNDLVLPLAGQENQLRRETPASSWRNVQGGARVSVTAGRVDMSVSAWRGFEGFGIISFEPLTPIPQSGPIPAVLGQLVERFPRFTMIAADAETVRGGWAVRGEVAAFVDKTINGPAGPGKGRAIDAGVGADRAAGDFHFFGSIVWHREWLTSSQGSTEHLNVIASVDRRFAREKYLVRVFGVVNPDDRSGFVRGLASWSVRDNLMLEASGGAFLGAGSDTIGRFNDRDFVFLRARYSF